MMIDFIGSGKRLQPAGKASRFSPELVFSGDTVHYLPGFSGKLPFNLETRYVSVGDSEMFYYYVESEGNPKTDPLLLWLTGGPGCSSWNGLVYENGPLEFDLDDYYNEGDFPKLRSYPYSWTPAASTIFLDSPVGTGFSYSRTPEGWPSSDTKAAKEAYEFLVQSNSMTKETTDFLNTGEWMVEHPEYSNVRFFVGGDAYSGIIVPLVTKLIIEGNEAGREPYLNLKGYIVGSPNTDAFIDANSEVPFAHRMALISDDMYQKAKKYCNENYVDVDESNTDCVLALADYEKGTIKRWSRCNQTISYVQDQPSVVNIHRYLTNYGLNVLVDIGDRDMVVPFVGVVQWIKSLNLTIYDEWRPWFVDAQIAGYTRQYAKKSASYSLTYATVKGGGHAAAEYYRQECYEMFSRWVNYYPL